MSGEQLIGEADPGPSAGGRSSERPEQTAVSRRPTMGESGQDARASHGIRSAYQRGGRRPAWRILA